MQHKRVYNVFQINLIGFYTICIMLIPIFAVVSYLFDFHLYTSTNSIFLIGSFLLLAFFVAGLIYLLITREQYERKLKPSYQQEFTLIMGVSALGVLGLGIVFIYLGGPILYVPHVIIPIAIFVYSLLYLVGNRYFNISLLRRRKK